MITVNDLSLEGKDEYINESIHYLGAKFEVHHNQVSFLNGWRAEGSRGILRCSTTTTVTSRGVSARGRCSPLPDGGCDGDDLSNLLVQVLMLEGTHVLVPLGTIVVAAPLFALMCDA